VEEIQKKFLSVSGQPYHILVRSKFQDHMLITDFLITKDDHPLWMYRLGLTNAVHQEQAIDKLQLIGLQFMQNMILTERFIRSSGKIELLNEAIQDGDWYTLPEL
jgi:hypothetical protein